MKHPYFSSLVFGIFLLSACQNGAKTQAIEDEVIINLDPSYFLEDNLAEAISTVACTLSDGTKAKCYKIVSGSAPTDHQMGPWCPEHITDSPEAGGIWLERGKAHDVDGAFIKNMATFYNDVDWLMYDAEGHIYRTNTKEDCAGAARPDVDPKYHSHCVECLPEYVKDITQTYLIPVTPVQSEYTNAFGRGARGLSVRGVAFNGIRFDAPAPTHAILGAHTLAPFDDAGGHINLHAGYHYHAATGASKQIPQPDGHAPMIGYALDGYGLYAHLDVINQAATDLDDCRGHYDQTRGYHYHVDEAGANNFINCLRGAYAE